jgi:hypothetical protein
MRLTNLDNTITSTIIIISCKVSEKFNTEAAILDFRFLNLRPFSSFAHCKFHPHVLFLA